MSFFIHLVKTFKAAHKNQLFEISGYISYATLLAIFPFLIMLVALAGQFGKTDVAQRFIAETYLTLPPQIVEFLKPIVEQTINARPETIMTLSSLSIVWLVISGIEALRTGLNNAYSIKDFRPFWFRMLQDILIMLAGVMTFLLSSFLIIILPIYINGILELVHLTLYEQMFVSYVTYILGGLFLILILVLMYRWLPCHPGRISHVFPGAFLAATLWVVMGKLFSLYLQYFSQYHVIYGSIVGVIITLIFLHLSMFFVMFGAQFNAVLDNRQKE